MRNCLELVIGYALLPLTLPWVALLCLFQKDGDKVAK
jgi:hypothetical protein